MRCTSSRDVVQSCTCRGSASDFGAARSGCAERPRRVIQDSNARVMHVARRRSASASSPVGTLVVAAAYLSPCGVSSGGGHRVWVRRRRGGWARWGFVVVRGRPGLLRHSARVGFRVGDMMCDGVFRQMVLRPLILSGPSPPGRVGSSLAGSWPRFSGLISGLPRDRSGQRDRDLFAGGCTERETGEPLTLFGGQQVALLRDPVVVEHRIGRPRVRYPRAPTTPFDAECRPPSPPGHTPNRDMTSFAAIGRSAPTAAPRGPKPGVEVTLRGSAAADTDAGRWERQRLLSRSWLSTRAASAPPGRLSRRRSARWSVAGDAAEAIVGSDDRRHVNAAAPSPKVRCCSTPTAAALGAALS